MSAEAIGILFKGGLTIFAGVCAVLASYRVGSPKPGVNLKYDAWHERYGLFIRIMGIIAILVGVIRIASG